ncbi:MAG: flagellar brake protein [Oscillospiraceae bacterium]
MALLFTACAATAVNYISIRDQTGVSNLDIAKLLRSGDEIRIGIGKNNFITKIFEISGEASFLILLPPDIAPPSAGDKYSVTCVSDRGIYLFKTEVLGLCRKPPSILLEAIGDCIRLQRRSTFRVKESLPVKVLELSNTTTPEWADATTADISETGLRLKYAKKCRIGQILKLVIHIDRLGMDVILPTVEGRVVRCEKSCSKSFDFLLGIQFEDLPEKSRNEILRFVVLSQRSALKDSDLKRYRNDE